MSIKGSISICNLEIFKKKNLFIIFSVISLIHKNTFAVQKHHKKYFSLSSLLYFSLTHIKEMDLTEETNKLSQASPALCISLKVGPDPVCYLQCSGKKVCIDTSENRQGQQIIIQNDSLLLFVPYEET